MSSNDPHEDPLICPIRGEFIACAPTELQPLVEFLQQNRPVDETAAFQRGTMLADGRLDLCKQSIGAGGAAIVAQGLKGTSQTKHLLLGANGLGSAGAKAVAGIVRESDSLETVYLGCNMIKADAVEALVDAIQDDSKINALWLKRNPIGKRGAQAVARLLRSGHDLQCLDLVHTEIEDEGLNEILTALIEGNTTVQRLYLCGNQIRPDQCTRIADLIESSTVLKHLFLSVNRIGDNGAAKVAIGLARNQTLQTLSLASDRIGCDGAIALAESLASSGLKHLELGCESSTFVLGEEPNHIGDRGAYALAEALRRSPRLVSLDLRRNAFTESAVRCLLRALDVNQTLCDLRLGRSLRRELRDWLNDALTRNRAQNGIAAVSDSHISAIQSVYRTPSGK